MITEQLTIPYIERELISLIGTETRGSRYDTMAKKERFTELLRAYFKANNGLRGINIQYIRNNWFNDELNPFNNAIKLSLLKLLNSCECLTMQRDGYILIKPNADNNGYVIERVERRNGFIELKA